MQIHDYRTPLEKEWHEQVTSIIESIGQRYGSRNDFIRFVGYLRMMRMYLDNRQYGCPSGKHIRLCVCEKRKAA